MFRQWIRAMSMTLLAICVASCAMREPAVEKTYDDAVISAAVKTKLARDRTATLTGIEVETVNRTVYLRGTAPDGAAKQRAASLARRVDGVVAVENELEVTKTTRAGDAPQ